MSKESWYSHQQFGDFQHQHLNLSEEAYRTIESDIDAFARENAEVKAVVGNIHSLRRNFSGFINRILQSYCENAEASISFYLKRKRQELENALHFLNDDSIKEAVLQALLQQYRKKIEEANSAYKKEHGFNIRLSNENYDRFYRDYSEECIYYASQGLYFKALLEEYARLPQIERERIYFGDCAEMLQFYIAQKQCMQISTSSKGTKLQLYFKGYGLLQSPSTGKNYLVGISRRKDDETDEWLPRALRLSAIEKLGKTAAYSGKITESEKNLLRERLKKGDPAYLNTEPIVVTLRFLQGGLDAYYKIQHQRPVLYKTKTADVFTAECTWFQAYSYFFRLGAGVEILSPESLRNRFAEEFGNAAAVYGENGKTD